MFTYAAVDCLSRYIDCSLMEESIYFSSTALLCSQFIFLLASVLYPSSSSDEAKEPGPTWWVHLDSQTVHISKRKDRQGTMEELAGILAILDQCINFPFNVHLKIKMGDLVNLPSFTYLILLYLLKSVDHLYALTLTITKMGYLII